MAMVLLSKVLTQRSLSVLQHPAKAVISEQLYNIYDERFSSKFAFSLHH